MAISTPFKTIFQAFPLVDSEMNELKRLSAFLKAITILDPAFSRVSELHTSSSTISFTASSAFKYLENDLLYIFRTILEVRISTALPLVVFSGRLYKRSLKARF